MEVDSPQKLAQIVDTLDQATHIAITSNRNYGSLTRVPAAYPMTVRYYDALFKGELGFRKLATFTSYPGLFGISIPDDAAEESFTVYDHPKVMLFEKTPTPAVSMAASGECIATGKLSCGDSTKAASLYQNGL